jgi:hypothetical protein
MKEIEKMFAEDLDVLFRMAIARGLTLEEVRVYGQHLYNSYNWEV